MNILVLQEVYPSDENPYSQAWSHTRNKAYRKEGCCVKVFCASETRFREYEGVSVYPMNVLNDHLDWSDIILAHQPNIKLHYKMLRRNKNKKIVYYIHGHEVMFVNEDYSKPFYFSPDSSLRFRLFRFLYDRIKVFLLKCFFVRQGVDKAAFVFVSRWMKDTFERRVGLNLDLRRFRYAVIPNAMNDCFLEAAYKPSANLYADFITIRQWDWSKHGVDLVIEAAKKNTDKTFHIYGKGIFPEFVEIPNNVKMINKFIAVEDIPNLLNHYRCALMPTRVDSQGVMAAEMASYGIPLISSDIDVAREFLSGFLNVRLVENSKWYAVLDIPEANLNKLGERYSSKNLCKEELEFYDYFINAPIVR